VATFSLSLRHHEENVKNAQLLAKLALEAGEGVPMHRNDPRGSLPGDPAALRGLPCIGVRGGFGGAIRGSRPDHAFIE
jgi:hypothetical protein